MFCYEAAALLSEFAARGYELVDRIDVVQFWAVPGKQAPLMISIGADEHCFVEQTDYAIGSLGEPPLKIKQVMCP